MLGGLIALATYLKPNQLLWIVPVFTLFHLINKRDHFSKIRLLGVVGVSLIPWLLFVNVSNPGPFTFTSASGGNLYIGTGMQTIDDGSTLAKAAKYWKVDPKSNPKDVIFRNENEDIRESSGIYSSKAFEIWKKRPIRQIGFGIAKVIIAFSIYTDSIGQSLLGFLVLISLILSVYILIFTSSNWRRRVLCKVYLSFIGILAFQAFVFQADRRFIFPILIPVAVLLFELKHSKTHKNANVELP
jgi:hypothetical protein